MQRVVNVPGICVLVLALSAAPAHAAASPVVIFPPPGVFALPAGVAGALLPTDPSGTIAGFSIYRPGGGNLLYTWYVRPTGLGPKPTALYEVDLWPTPRQAARANRAKNGETGSAARPVPSFTLPHSAEIGAWLRGVVATRPCGVWGGAAWLNVQFQVVASTRNGNGRRCVSWATAVLGALVQRAQGYARRVRV